ncbi:MAG: ribonuclease P protein component [Candidatus Nealsonbacteria bacterium]|nr:ribonuclease P protein component [Candidatus Nealsonbacteria bacterium]
MLSFENRLKKEKDFDRVFKEGKGVVSDEVVIKFIKNDLNNNRFGFIVSKKVSKKAVRRNRIKRVLREQVRSIIQDMSVGWDVIIIARPKISENKSSDVNQILGGVFKRIGILK